MNCLFSLIGSHLHDFPVCTYVVNPSVSITINDKSGDLAFILLLPYRSLLGISEGTERRKRNQT